LKDPVGLAEWDEDLSDGGFAEPLLFDVTNDSDDPEQRRIWPIRPQPYRPAHGAAFGKIPDGKTVIHDDRQGRISIVVLIEGAAAEDRDSQRFEGLVTHNLPVRIYVFSCEGGSTGDLHVPGWKRPDRR
jgi:hypothetical protein